MDCCTDLKSHKMLIIRGNSKNRCPIAEVLYHRTSVDRVGLMRWSSSMLSFADEDTGAQRQAVIGPRHTAFSFSDSNARVHSDTTHRPYIEQPQEAHMSVSFIDVLVGYLSTCFLSFLRVSSLFMLWLPLCISLNIIHIYFLNLIILAPVVLIGLILLFIISAVSCSWWLISSHVLWIFKSWVHGC